MFPGNIGRVERVGQPCLLVLALALVGSKLDGLVLALAIGGAPEDSPLDGIISDGDSVKLAVGDRLAIPNINLDRGIFVLLRCFHQTQQFWVGNFLRGQLHDVKHDKHNRDAKDDGVQQKVVIAAVFCLGSTTIGIVLTHGGRCLRLEATLICKDAVGRVYLECL